MKVRVKKRYRLKKHIKQKLKHTTFIISLIAALFMFTSSFALFKETKINTITGTIGSAVEDGEGMIVFEYDLSLPSYVNIHNEELADQTIYVYEGTYEENKDAINNGFIAPLNALTNLTADTNLQNIIGASSSVKIYTVVATKFTKTNGSRDGSFINNGLINIPKFDIKQLETIDLSYLFLGAFEFNKDISHWDVSNVTNMKGMFQGASDFNQDIGSWDVSNVTNMDSMFHLAKEFNQDIGNWNVSRVTNMDAMFNFAAKFKQDLFNWTPNIDKMPNLFCWNAGFHAINELMPKPWQTTFDIIFEYQINNENKTKAIVGYRNRRFYTFTDERPPTIGELGFDESLSLKWISEAQNLTFSTSMVFDEKINTTQPIIFKPDISFVHVAFEYYLSHGNQAYLNIDKLNGKDVYVYNGAYSNIKHKIDQGYSDWDYRFNDLDADTNLISKVKDEGHYTFVTSHFKSTANSNSNPSLIGVYNFDSVDLENEDISYLFKGAGELGTDLYNWNTTNVKNMEGLFMDNNSFYSSYAVKPNISNWDVGNVTNMKSIFMNNQYFNQDISSWDVSNVKDMSHMFEGSAFNKSVNNWDVSNVTNMSRMFKGSSFNNNSINNWNTSKVTNMASMFKNSEIYFADIKNWNTKNVTDMSSMFENSIHFQQDIGNWNVSNVTNMDRMLWNTPNFYRSLAGWENLKIPKMPEEFSNTSYFLNDKSLWPLQWQNAVQNFEDVDLEDENDNDDEFEKLDNPVEPEEILTDDINNNENDEESDLE